jgi:hypothetical protein
LTLCVKSGDNPRIIRPRQSAGKTPCKGARSEIQHKKRKSRETAQRLPSRGHI